MDAAAALGAVWLGSCRIFTFTTDTKEIAPRRGMAGVDAIINSQPHSATKIWKAVETVNNESGIDRMVVITDEQSYDTVPNPASRGYMINVASYRNGVGYGPWTHIDGFSENVISFIAEAEKQYQADQTRL